MLTPTVGLEFEEVRERKTVIGYNVCGLGSASGKIVFPTKHNGLPVIAIAEGAFDDCDEITEVVIPNGIKCVEDNAFYDCSNLTSVFVGASVWKLMECAFNGCVNLQKVVFEEGSTCVNIASGCFSYCDLREFVIPKSVRFVGGDVVSNCPNLQKISFEPGSICEEIGDSAFEGCPITEITIPKTVQSLGSWVFCRCQNLKRVIFEQGSCCNDVNSWCFSKCPNLREVNLPSTVLHFGVSAFDGCPMLAKVTVCDQAEVEKDVFANCDKLTIYCGASSPLPTWHKDWNPNKRPVVWNAKI